MTEEVKLLNAKQFFPFIELESSNFIIRYENVRLFRTVTYLQ